MAYDTEAHTGYLEYEIVIDNVAPGVGLQITVDPFSSNGETPDEASRDAAFQAFLTAAAGIVGVTLVSATKRGNFAANVTP